VTSAASTSEPGAVLLSGGGAVRFGGADKASIEVAGQTLLERALHALAEIPDLVVVGDEVPTSRPVTFLREDPPGGGPAAGLLAGLAGFPRLPPVVVVLAVDMPLVSADTLSRLVRALENAGDGDGALLVDEGGRRQYLCAAYRTAALLAAAPDSGQRHGLPVRKLVGGLRLVDVPAVGAEAQDVDTWDDLRALRSRLED
jgi:molybdopterin-guanine dinucleotide biosynthesis protein A